MVFLFTLVHILYAESNDCPEFHVEVNQAKENLWIGDVPAMEDSIEQAQIALECAHRLEPETVRNDLGDFFLLNAYHAHLGQDPIERTWWLQQSFNLGHWNGNFGPEIEAFRSELTSVEKHPVSVLSSTDKILNYVVDGSPMEQLILEPGLHWVEMYHDNVLLNAQLLFVQPGSFIQVPELVGYEKQVELTERKVSPWFASAVFFSSVALSTHTVAMLSHQQYGESTSLLQLEEQRLQTWRWGQSSIFSGVIALGCVSMSLIGQKQSKSPRTFDENTSGLE
jgi:hypothetical protein